MENSKKAIMIGVGLFLTILVVSIVLLVTNLGITTTNESKDKIVNINKGLQNQLVNQYDRIAITGQDVINFISRNMEELNGNIFVETPDPPWNTSYRISSSSITANTIVTPTSPSPTYYAVGISGSYIKLVSLGDSSTKSDLINTVNRSTMYIGYLVRDATTMNVMGIIFRFKT